MLSTKEILVLVTVGLIFAVRWIALSMSRRSLEAQILQALEGVTRAECHWWAKLSETNVPVYNMPAYIHVHLTFLDIERKELNAMLTSVRAGEKVSFARIHRLEKLVARYYPGAPLDLLIEPL